MTMKVSVFNIFSIGLGPSSSHTVGPMRAAFQFIVDCERKGLFSNIASLTMELYGSLAQTGIGHAIDLALLLGLEGNTPEGIDPNEAPKRIAVIRKTEKLNLLGKKEIHFIQEKHLISHKNQELPYHPNAIRFTIYTKDNKEIESAIFYSTGGGFIINHEDTKKEKKVVPTDTNPIPFHFKTPTDLLDFCHKNHMSIREIVMENEKIWHTEEEIKKRLLTIWQVMKDTVTRGCEQEGILPGGLNIPRRAKKLKEKLAASKKTSPLEAIEWVNMWALATNEENAAGSRIVTAPTNGASGVIPAVLHYYERFTPNPTEEGLITFFLTAGAIGILYKKGASISAAEMGCMGEVGVACSMAAAGLTAALGGTVRQVENAAAIAMEHNLGLTCDPVNGLVQIPCIERNCMGALEAINASTLALREESTNYVTLQEVLKAMKLTGDDMSVKYKETSLGGLALTVKRCG